MVSGEVVAVVVVVTLAVFVWIGIRAMRRDGDLEDYVVARNSQPGSTLGLSFLAAGMGAWVLFAPPEVGATVGLLGVLGYALGAAAPFVVFGLLGRRIRTVLPAGHSLPEFLTLRFGRGFSMYVAVISLLYMLCFVTAELTAVGAVTSILSGFPAAGVIVAVTAATLIYTAIGGLRASLQTDRFQAWLIIALLAAAAYAMLGTGSAATADAAPAAPDTPVRVGLEVALTLVIAVTAANMFHQGYWQRVWAARDHRALRRGVGTGALATIPVVAVLGFIGYDAAARGLALGTPPAPFFAHLAAAPTWLTLPVLILAIALVTSSVDTLENGLASLVAPERRGVTLTTARVLTVAFMVPAVLIALQGFSVLRLFLVADLLCAATVVPALASLWRRATGGAALAGAVAGLLGAGLGGIVATGSLRGVEMVTMPGAVPTLPPFLGAIIASVAVTVAVSLTNRSATNIEQIGAGVPALSNR
ncbi:MAG: sodium:solute symporter [Nitriliruptorales bacterium]|nr:sodium:solute symporter [Nitriliruptorales bacterium]